MNGSVKRDTYNIKSIPISGPSEIKSISKEYGKSQGSILMSSGGTTGLPKLTYVSHDLGHKKLLSEWPALEKNNVMLNLFNAGKLWGSHYHLQGLAQHAGCTVVPTGPISIDEVEKWLTILSDVSIDVVAGNPSGLYDFARGCLKIGKIQESVKKIIWLAEPWTPIKLDAVKEAFPNAEFWGNYGSVETFIIGTSKPECTLGTFHLLPGQVIEPDNEGALLTRVGDGWTVPTLRYRLGDIIEATSCICGRDHALIVKGRADDAISVRGTKISVMDIINYTLNIPGIDSVQLVLSRDGDSPRSSRSLYIDYIGKSDDDIKSLLLKNFFHLKIVDDTYPDAIKVRQRLELSRIERTNKIPNLIWD